MPRGRPPKAVEARRLEGGSEVSHRPLPEPLLVAGRPQGKDLEVAPDWLPNDAKEFWADSVLRLKEVGILDLVDQPALEMLATSYARWRQAQRAVASEGHFTLGSAGQIKEHPALKIERESQAAFLRLASEFALTPIARTRLGLAELSGRAMAKEMADSLSAPSDEDEPVTDAEVVHDDDVGLPGGA